MFSTLFVEHGPCGLGGRGFGLEGRGFNMIL